MFFVVVLFIAVKDLAYSFLSGKFLWGILVLLFSTINIGGYMWNTIRNPPFIANEDGRPAFFASGFQNQYGVETFIVAGLCKQRF